jgi:hypothetical protein
VSEGRFYYILLFVTEIAEKAIYGFVWWRLKGLGGKTEKESVRCVTREKIQYM